MTDTLSNQRGIALLTVLGLLSVLLILASLVAGSSRNEATLSGLGKESARAFAASEAGLNYGLNDVNNFVSANSTTKCCPGSTETSCAPAGTASYNATDLAAAGLGVTGYVRVCFDHQGPPPTSIKVSALRFKAFHFDLDSQGKTSTNGASYLEMEAARLGPSE